VSTPLVSAEEVAEELASSFARKRGVVGVVYLGALARGYFDEHSDIDIVVYKRRGVRLGWPREKEYTYKGFTVDLEVRDYEKELRRPWTPEERWVFLNARIRYDPEGLVRKLFELKARLTERERIRLLEDELRRAEWSLGDARAWLHRGSLLSAHYTVTVALRHLLRSIVLLNGLPPPPDKWLIHAAMSSEKQPPQLEKLMRDALECQRLDAQELKRRVSVVELLLDWARSQSARRSWRERKASRGSITGAGGGEESRRTVEEEY